MVLELILSLIFRSESSHQSDTSSSGNKGGLFGGTASAAGSPRGFPDSYLSRMSWSLWISSRISDMLFLPSTLVCLTIQRCGIFLQKKRKVCPLCGHAMPDYWARLNGGWRLVPVRIFFIKASHYIYYCSHIVKHSAVCQWENST